MVSKAPQFDALPLEPTLAARCGLQVIGAPTSAAAAQQGNQGTALVVRKVTSFPSDYSAAPSHKPSSCNAAYFRCVPRELVPHSPGRVRLQIKVFERHPFTRQAFIPMGRKSKCRAYVVIVTEDKGVKELFLSRTDGKMADLIWIKFRLLWRWGIRALCMPKINGIPRCAQLIR